MRAGYPPLVGLLALMAFAACSDDPLPRQLARFDRPIAMDFICVAEGEPVRLEHCENSDGFFSLHALVAQSARGEVAAVNLEEHEILDNRRDVPGFTFVPVGELPVAIAVPKKRPWVTYVAAFGSREVRALDTRALISATATDATLQVVPLPGAPTHMLLSPDEDALFLSIPELGEVIWLPLIRCPYGDETCREGLIDEAGLASIDLAGSGGRLVMPTPSEPSIYQQLCDFERPAALAPASVALPDPAALGTPRPAGMALNAFCEEGDCTRELLVADKATTLIHRIDADAIEAGSSGSEALLDPIVAGVQTRALAVTPLVPSSLQSGGETQYTYAIDDTDGSILAIENGQVLNLHAAPFVRPDRIRLDTAGIRASAAAIEILTPAFELSGAAEQYVRGDEAPENASKPELYCTDPLVHEEQNPARLRGVFLAAAMSDGTLRVIDVHDMEMGPLGEKAPAPCHTCPEQKLPLLIRNHARLAVTFRAEEGRDAPSIAPITNAFRFTVAGENQLFDVRTDGSSGAAKAPRLCFIPCETGYAQTFPDSSEDALEEDAGAGDDEDCFEGGSALLCGSIDPFIGAEDSWTVAYEGSIPGTVGGEGRFVTGTATESGTLEFHAERDFCSLGVLGREDIGGAYPASCVMPQGETESVGRCAEPTLAGDQLVITSEVLGSAGLAEDEGLRERCEDLRSQRTADPEEEIEIAFEIRRAYGSRLVLADCMLNPIGQARLFDDVAACLGHGPLRYVVKTRKAFTVQGLQAGFQHRVQRNAANRCVVDAAADPLQQGRARAGCTFQNHSLAFHIEEPTAIPHGVSLFVQMQTPVEKMAFDVASSSFFPANVVPVQLRYNRVDRRLYLLDSSDRGLVPISLDPFPFVDPRDQYN